jgi:hypothetical protein
MEHVIEEVFLKLPNVTVTPVLSETQSDAFTIPELVARLRAEYAEMPGMRLTLDQVVRLCGIEKSRCKDVLDALVEGRFLSLNADGMYSRSTDDADRKRTAQRYIDRDVSPRIIRRAS